MTSLLISASRWCVTTPCLAGGAALGRFVWWFCRVARDQKYEPLLWNKRPVEIYWCSLPCAHQRWWIFLHFCISIFNPYPKIWETYSPIFIRIRIWHWLNTKIPCHYCEPIRKNNIACFVPTKGIKAWKTDRKVVSFCRQRQKICWGYFAIRAVSNFAHI